MIVYITLSMLLSFVFWAINIDQLGNLGTTILTMVLLGLLIVRLQFGQKCVTCTKINLVIYTTLFCFLGIFILFLIFFYKPLIIISSILQLSVYFFVSFKYKGFLRPFVIFVFSAWLLSAIVVPVYLAGVTNVMDITSPEVLVYIIAYILSVSFSVILSNLQGIKYKILSWINIIIPIVTLMTGSILLLSSMYFDSIIQTVIQYLAFLLFFVTIIILYLLILACLFVCFLRTKKHDKYM